MTKRYKIYENYCFLKLNAVVDTYGRFGGASLRAEECSAARSTKLSSDIREDSNPHSQCCEYQKSRT